MQSIRLLSVEVVTDDSTGSYAVGEVDWGICVGLLEDYLRGHGVEGRDALLSALTFLAHRVWGEWENLPDRDLPHARSTLSGPGER